jgi:hypothetical protein
MNVAALLVSGFMKPFSGFTFQLPSLEQTALK